MNWNRYANKYPAICYKCGKPIKRGDGRLVPWRMVTRKPMRVQCLEHTEKMLSALAQCEAEKESGK